jgi:hypothetical protein
MKRDGFAMEQRAVTETFSNTNSLKGCLKEAEVPIGFYRPPGMNEVGSGLANE